MNFKVSVLILFLIGSTNILASGLFLPKRSKVVKEYTITEKDGTEKRSFVMTSVGNFQAFLTLANGTANSLWVGTNEKDFGGDGEVTVNASELNLSFGLLKGLELSSKISYRKAEMTKGMEGGRVKGDFVEGISELGFQISKQLYSSITSPKSGKELIIYVGHRTPGNGQANPNDFLAINDGGTKYDFGLIGGIHSPWVSLSVDTRLTKRPGRQQKDQYNVNLSVPIHMFDEWLGFEFGPTVSVFDTVGGIDIGDDDFKAIFAETGSRPFSLTKEEYTGAGIFIDYWKYPASYTFSYVKKIEGRNTDVGSNLSLGISYSM